MRVLKRLAGVLTLFLGSVGVLACLGGFVGTWGVRSRMDTMVNSESSRSLHAAEYLSRGWELLPLFMSSG